MPDQHKTQDIDQLSVIRGLLERQADILEKQSARNDVVEAKVDALRGESAARGAEQAKYNASFEAQLATVRHEVGVVANRVTIVEGRVGHAEQEIRQLEETDAKNARQTSELDVTTQAALGGAIAHVAVVDDALEKQAEAFDKQTKATEAQTEKQERVNKAFAAVLSVDYEAIAKAPEDGAAMEVAKPKNSLATLARENKVGSTAAALAFITAVVQLAIELLKHH